MSDERDRNLAAALVELHEAWAELKAVMWADRWNLGLAMVAVWLAGTATIALAWLLGGGTP